MNEKLKRNDAADKFYGYHSKNNVNSNEEILKYLEIIEEYLNSHQYESDADFIMGGRKKFIYNEMFDILDGKKKEDNPLYFVLGSLEEFISNPNQVFFEDVDKSKWKDGKTIDGKDYAELRDRNDVYSSKGIICLEEKTYIEKIIDKIKQYINGLEDNSMGLFDKKDKYNIKEEDNVPEFVYGTPDFMRKENQNNKEKYDVNAEDNMPQIVYGIPDFMKNDDFFKKDNQENKYDIQPEDNMPREVYGIPDFMLEDRKNKVFEAFVGGYSGPSSFYYINKVNEEYEFRYGFSQSGAKIFNNPNNKDLHIIKHNKQFYEDFKNNLIQLTKDWSKQGYYDNQIMDGTQWNIDIDIENAITYSGSNAFPKDFNKVMNYIDEIFETKKSNNLKKYEIAPEQNVPQKVYGVPNNMPNSKYDINPENNVPQRVYGIPNLNDINARKCPYCGSIELWKYLYGEPTFDYDKDKYVLGGCEITGNQPTHKCKKCGKDVYPDSNFIKPSSNPIIKESIKISIKNEKNNYALLLNHASNSKMYDIVFADLNNLDGKVISDLSTNIPEKYYSQFISKLYRIINEWKGVYSGESNTVWSIKYSTENKKGLISGNGGFPSNWNEFIDLLVEYEILFKKKKNVDMDVINDMEYDKLTFDEAVKSKVKDPFFSDMIIKYFKVEEKVTDIVAKIIFKDLMKYDDILNEFTKCLSQKTYDLKDAIEINGYTAKQISELNPNFGVCGVYTFMKTLRDDKENAEKIIKSGFPNKDVVPPTFANNNED